MTRPGDFDPALAAEIRAIGTEWEQHVRSTSLADQARSMGGLLVYDLDPEDSLDVTMSSFDGVGEDRIVKLVKTRIDRTQSGLLRVTDDSTRSDSWTGLELNLGSYSDRIGIGNIRAQSPGLLRGFIVRGGMVAVDLAGRHFVHPDSRKEYLPLLYSQLVINGVTVFDTGSEPPGEK